MFTFYLTCDVKYLTVE